MVSFFVQMKIGKFVDINQNNLEITSRIMKNTWKFTLKDPGKVMEIFQSGKVGTLSNGNSDNNGHDLKIFSFEQILTCS